MPWYIVSDSDNCDWFFTDQSKRLCANPDNEGMPCTEEACPLSLYHIEQREYKKYEFCKAVGCHFYFHKNRFEKEKCAVGHTDRCPFTAKEFHHWLTEHDFEIRKR